MGALFRAKNTEWARPMSEWMEDLVDLLGVLALAGVALALAGVAAWLGLDGLVALLMRAI